MVKNFILVSGIHISGSTWVGKIIGKSDDVMYIHESFNIALKKDNVPIDLHFDYIDKSTELAKQEQISKYLKSFADPWNIDYRKNVRNSINSFKDLIVYLKKIFQNTYY